MLTRSRKMTMAVALIVPLLLLLAPEKTLALDNGLALTPPMGWLNWQRFTCQTDCANYPDDCISSRLFRQMADLLVGDGYRRAGYEYVNIDDCWSELERDAQSERLVANRSRFPEDIGQLASYVHAKGLKLGIYGDCGYKTCAGYPAQLRPARRAYLNEPPAGDYFELDAQTFAGWAIDSFKFDGCFIEALEAESLCPGMSRALARQRRPILLVCEWPFYMMYAHTEPDFSLAAESCNVWRYYDDIEDSWQSILNTIDYTVKHQSTIVKYHGPGHWFDPDQLVIGNFGLSHEQSWAQMTLWCIWSAPLYMSNDLRSIQQSARNILINSQLIAINQDRLGVFGQMVREDRGSEQQEEEHHYQAFVKPILPIVHECPSFAVVYLNRNLVGGQKKVSFKLGDLLTGAPLHAARKHALELAERQPDDPIAVQAANFSPSRCLEWLKEGQDARDQAAPPAASKSWTLPGNGGTSDGDDDDDDDKAENVKRPLARFKVFDLIDEDKQLFNERAIGVGEELRLPVNPSGVRAIRLEAMP